MRSARPSQLLRSSAVSRLWRKGLNLPSWLLSRRGPLTPHIITLLRHTSRRHAPSNCDRYVLFPTGVLAVRSPQITSALSPPCDQRLSPTPRTYFSPRSLVSPASSFYSVRQSLRSLCVAPLRVCCGPPSFRVNSIPIPTANCHVLPSKVSAFRKRTYHAVPFIIRRSFRDVIRLPGASKGYQLVRSDVCADFTCWRAHGVGTPRSAATLICPSRSTVFPNTTRVCSCGIHNAVVLRPSKNTII